MQPEVRRETIIALRARRLGLEVVRTILYGRRLDVRGAVCDRCGTAIPESRRSEPAHLCAACASTAEGPQPLPPPRPVKSAGWFALPPEDDPERGPALAVVTLKMLLGLAILLLTDWLLYRYG